MSAAPPLPLPIESGTLVAIAVGAGVEDGTTLGGVADIVVGEHAAIAATAINEPSWNRRIEPIIDVGLVARWSSFPSCSFAFHSWAFERKTIGNPSNRSRS